MRRNIIKPKKKYLIALEETRSIVALVAGILIFVCALMSIFYMVENYKGNYEYPLKYFTVLSNILSAVAAAFMIPYAVEGIRKKRFVLPRWIVLFQYTAANCLAITLVSALTLILPAHGAMAVSGINFLLHIITPALTIALFQCVETGVEFKCSESLLTLIPYWVYMAVYFFMVIIIGEKNGGWSDFYMAQAFLPVWITVLLMIVIGFVISTILFIIHNKLAKRFWKYVEKMWSDSIEPTQLLIESFGLGRYIGAKYTDGDLSLPLDIFKVISKQYGIPLDNLTKAYIKGALDAIEERDSQ